MNRITILLILFFSLNASAQVFKGTEATTTLKDSGLFMTASRAYYLGQALADTIPKRIIYPTTMSKQNIVDISLMLTKPDGSIIIIDNPWRLNVKRELDRIVIISPDSSRTIYRVVNRLANDTLITIPFKISKKVFDGANNIKLEIIR